MDLDGRGVGEKWRSRGRGKCDQDLREKKNLLSVKGGGGRKLRDSGGRLGPGDPGAVEDTHCTQPPTCFLHFLPRNSECEQLQMRLWIFPLCK